MFQRRGKRTGSYVRQRHNATRSAPATNLPRDGTFGTGPSRQCRSGFHLGEVVGWVMANHPAAIDTD